MEKRGDLQIEIVNMSHMGYAMKMKSNKIPFIQISKKLWILSFEPMWPNKNE